MGNKSNNNKHSLILLHFKGLGPHAAPETQGDYTHRLLYSTHKIQSDPKAKTNSLSLSLSHIFNFKKEGRFDINGAHKSRHDHKNILPFSKL